MAHLFLIDQDRWQVLALASARIALSADGKLLSTGENGEPDSAALWRVGAEQWVLLPGRAPVFVNGEPLRAADLTVLAHRDEIRFGDARFFYSTEIMPRVRALDAQPKQVFCGRCKTSVPPDSPVVACPGCGVIVHQTDELPCWTGCTGNDLFQTCPLCDTPASLNTFRWVPIL